MTPQFPVPEGYDLESYFVHIAKETFERRLPIAAPVAGGGTETHRGKVPGAPGLRAGHILKMGFPGYFLLVWDFIRKAREMGVPVGPGRGSAAGSIVAWSMRITDIDPMQYDLLFERFLNPERVSMPDVDIDFCTDGRQRGHRLRHGEIRPGQGEQHRHHQPAQDQGCDQGRGAGLREGLRLRQQPHQARSPGTRQADHGRRGPGEERQAPRALRERSGGEEHPGHLAAPGGPGPQHRRPRRRRHHRPR